MRHYTSPPQVAALRGLRSSPASLWNPSRTFLPAPASAAPASIAKPRTPPWPPRSPPRPPTSISSGASPGPSRSCKHHRGITHTFIAVPFVAAVAVGVAWLFHRWRSSRAAKLVPKHGPGKRPTAASAARVRWGWLYLAAFIAALTHILLDWTNNYGVRPSFPSIPAGMRAASCSSPSRCSGRCSYRAFIFPWSVRPHRSRNRRAPHALSRPRLGHLRSLRHGRRLVLALGGACAGPAMLENTQVDHRADHAHGRRALPRQSLPLARHPRNAADFIRPPKSIPTPAPSTASRSATCSTSPPTRPPSKPPSAPSSARSISTGARGPWSATSAKMPIPASIRRTSCLAEPGPPSSSPISASPTPSAAPAAPPAFASRRLGLHRRQPRRSRRRHGQPRPKMMWSR